MNPIEVTISSDVPSNRWSDPSLTGKEKVEAKFFYDRDKTLNSVVCSFEFKDGRYSLKDVVWSSWRE